MRLRKAKHDNRLDTELEAIGKAELLIIDELGYLPIDIEGARLLFQVIADSYETRSVLSASNLESGRWGDVFGDGDMAAAAGDRIVHHGRTVRFHGESCVSASWRPQYGHYFSAAQAAGFQQEPHRRNPPPLFPWLSGHEGVLAAV